MPRRERLRPIMVVGSGPIVIGQACEFDYSGTQACKVLRARGLPGGAGELQPRHDHDRPRVRRPPPTSSRSRRRRCWRIIERERPDALLPTLGGQTALNVAVALAESGDLDRLGVQLIGASLEAIHRAEDRSGFKRTMLEAGLDVPRAGIAHTLDGGARARGGARVSRHRARLVHARRRRQRVRRRRRRSSRALAARALAASPVARDPGRGVDRRAGRSSSSRSCATAPTTRSIVCSIENVDPMGVHTGDSITVAPAQTLTDREYQAMRDAALACIRAIGVETGGSNVQFAVDPRRRPHGADRDEPAGLALQRARVEGHRVPDREDRGAARRRLPARRDHERHHRRDAGRVRADARLRRGEDPAVGVREVPRGRPARSPPR